MKSLIFTFVNDCSIRMPLQLRFTLPDSRISLVIFTFPFCEAWMSADFIEFEEKKKCATLNNG